jgi:hypothetical protein
MDPTKDNLEDTLEELREALRELKTEEVTNTGAVSGTYGSADTITLSSLSGPQLYNNTVIGGGYTVGTGMNFPNNVTTNAGPYTVSNGTSGINWGANITASPWATTASPTIQLDGEGADIKINGWSLIDAIQKIEERLNILHPNTELETEWDELKELGDRYRELEAKLKEQSEMWTKLKSMPPPDSV